MLKALSLSQLIKDDYSKSLCPQAYFGNFIDMYPFMSE